MAEISLTRIDSRLIHGQVITKWLKKTNADKILIIDDALSKDPFMRKIYEVAAPPGVQVIIMDIDTAVNAWNNNEFNNASLLVLFKDVPTVVTTCRKGFPVKELQVGGLGAAPGRKVVYNQITLDQEDANRLKELEEGGVEVYFQTVPEDRPANLDRILKKAKF